MAKYRIKIVPKATPNADGEWREAEGSPIRARRWLRTALAFSKYVPETHFICAVERVADNA